MKKTMIKIGALFASAAIMLGSSVQSFAAGDEFYTYNYDFWEDVQNSPDAYEVAGVYTGVELGLEVGLKNPEGLFVAGNMVYICDAGNNRIVEMERTSPEKFEVKRIVSEITGDVEVKTFALPSDFALSEDGYFYVADTNNHRVLKLTQDFEYVMEFVKPNDSTLDPKLEFQPTKLAVDTAGRVYCIATGINKGLIKYENDGTFSGFVGATPVTYDWTDYIWKRLATQEQREQLASFVPTEYNNIYMDYEGFIYCVTGKVSEEDLRSEAADAVRKLNLMGTDILVRNGNYPVYGDLYWGEGGGYQGPSFFTDVTAFENDVYVCLDKNRGRLFAYDDQGRLVYAFGGNGNMDGYFRRPSALEHMDYDLLVADSLDNSITLFTPTEYGRLIFQAIDQFDAGEYTASGETWSKVMNLNGNYDLAYIGVGRSLLRQEKYGEAMEYFELKMDEDNYSKAFKQYRKIWVEENIVIIFIVIFAVLLLPAAIGKIKAIKHEIDTADIFKE